MVRIYTGEKGLFEKEPGGYKVLKPVMFPKNYHYLLFLYIECSLKQCMMYCPNGFEQVNGCDICKCKGLCDNYFRLCLLQINVTTYDLCCTYTIKVKMVS